MPTHDALSPLRALSRQLARRPVGLPAALLGHTLLLSVPLGGLLAGAVYAGERIERATHPDLSAGALLAAVLLGFAVTVLLWRPLLDTGLARALDAEADQHAGLGPLAALSFGADAPRAVGARLVTELLVQLVAPFAVPLFVVPVRVARGATLSDAFGLVLRRIVARPAWHVAVWLLLLAAVAPVVLLLPPLGYALLVAASVHVDRCLDDDAPAPPGSAAADLAWATIAVMALCNVLETVLGLAWGVSASVDGDPGGIALAAGLAARSLVGWGLLAHLTQAQRRGPAARQRAAIAVAAGSLALTACGAVVGCCYGWVLVGVLALVVAVLPVPPDR
ncbi:MAG: hypothetical protein R3F59_32360 [Myxococcota bacterium]